MTLDNRKAREVEDQALSGEASEVADAFRAITELMTA